MSYSMNTRFLVGAIETVPGTPQALTAADFNVRIRNPEVSPIIEWDNDASKFANGNHGEDEAIAGAQSATINFAIRLGIGASVSTAPNYAKYLNGCGLKGNAYSTTGIGYQPVKEYDNKTMTIYVYDVVTGGATPGAIVYKFAGCMGNLTIGCEGIGKPLIGSFSFTGKCVGIDDVAYASIPEGYDLAEAHPEKMLGTSLDIGGVTGCISSWQIDLGNEISPLPCQSETTGYAYYQITNRKPRLGMDPLMQSVATDNVWDNMLIDLCGITGIHTNAITIGMGHLDFYIPRSQQIQANLANRDGVINWDASYRAMANGYTGSVGFTGFAPEVTFEMLIGTRSW